MVSIIGFLFLCLSIITNLFVVFSNIINFFRLSYNKIIFISRFATIFILLSFLSLIFAYIISDFSNYNVFQNSHSSKPILYKISGAWGNHEGSMLMWITIMSIYSFIFSFVKKIDESLKFKTIFFQSILFILFSFYLVFVSNPFLANNVNVSDGLGLNPVLQDPALAIHPPALYLGYVGYSLIFSFAIAGIVEKKINNDWFRVLKNWSLFCWSMLTLGIGLGCYWAYYELGWGGWWFWDPVENVSLMPWIAGLALVHSLFISKGEQVLTKWIVFLSILCFSLSIFGTFLVRSGILTSVHSFASDPSRGLFILLIFFLITGFGLTIFLLKMPEDKKSIKLLFLNKTSSLIINNIIMIIACLTILLGTIYPIIIEVLTDTRISVGGPYFNSTVLPIMLPGFLLMSIAPSLSWQTNKLKNYKYYSLVLILLSLLIVLISIFTYLNPWLFIGLFLGSWIILASLIAIIFIEKKSFKLKFLKHINAYIAHIGVGILIIGITFSSLLKEENDFSLNVGEEISFANSIILFEEITVESKNNFQKLRGKFIIKKNDINFAQIEAGKNYYHVSKTITTEAGIYHDWFKDIYILLGGQENEKWSIKIYNNPLVSFIWIGIFIMVISGLLGVTKK